MKIPAVCRDCETIFPSKLRMIHVTNVAFTKTEREICPNCGGRGYIPDGTFNVLDNVIESMEYNYKNVVDLERASLLLRKLSSKEITVVEMEKELKDELFSFASTLNLLPKTKKERSKDLKFFMKAAIAIVDVLIAKANARNETVIEVNQVIEKIYENEEKELV